MASPALIDSAFLAKLERLTLHWQRSFGGVVGGHNVSRFAGPGQEFLDHRHFHHGDDLRAVNWRAYMRLEKLFLKLFQVEPRVPVRILFDASESMTTGTGKFDFARRLAAALTYVGLVRLDTICLQPFRSQLEETCVATGGRHRFAAAAQFLEDLKPSGRTDFLAVAREFIGRYPQRGLAIIISDFLDDQGAERPLEYLSEFGHELMLVQVWAPQDREPATEGEVELTDSETGERIEMTVDGAARAAYVEAFDAWSRSLESLADRRGGRYVGLASDTAIEEAVFGPLAKVGVVG